MNVRTAAAVAVGVLTIALSSTATALGSSQAAPPRSIGAPPLASILANPAPKVVIAKYQAEAPAKYVQGLGLPSSKPPALGISARADGCKWHWTQYGWWCQVSVDAYTTGKTADAIAGAGGSLGGYGICVAAAALDGWPAAICVAAVAAFGYAVVSRYIRANGDGKHCLQISGWYSPPNSIKGIRISFPHYVGNAGCTKY